MHCDGHMTGGMIHDSVCMAEKDIEIQQGFKPESSEFQSTELLELLQWSRG